MALSVVTQGNKPDYGKLTKSWNSIARDFANREAQRLVDSGASDDEARRQAYAETDKRVRQQSAWENAVKGGMGDDEAEIFVAKQFEPKPSPAAIPAPRSGVIAGSVKEFGKGIASGVISGAGALGQVLDASSKGKGSGYRADAGLNTTQPTIGKDLIKWAGNRQGNYAPRVGTMADIKGGRDIFEYLAGKAGAGVGSTGSIIAATAMGGPVAGTAVAGGMAFGGIRGELADMGVEADGLAAALAIPVALLDRITPSQLASKLASRGIAKTIVKEAAERGLTRTVIRATMKSAATEAATEAVQEGVQYGGTRVGTGTPLQAKELRNRLLEAAVGGAVGGGLMGGAASTLIDVPAIRQARKATLRAEKADDAELAILAQEEEQERKAVVTTTAATLAERTAETARLRKEERVAQEWQARELAKDVEKALAKQTQEQKAEGKAAFDAHSRERQAALEDKRRSEQEEADAIEAADTERAARRKALGLSLDAVTTRRPGGQVATPAAVGTPPSALTTALDNIGVEPVVAARVPRELPQAPVSATERLETASFGRDLNEPIRIPADAPRVTPAVGRGLEPSGVISSPEGAVSFGPRNWQAELEARQEQASREGPIGGVRGGISGIEPFPGARTISGPNPELRRVDGRLVATSNLKLAGDDAIVTEYATLSTQQDKDMAFVSSIEDHPDYAEAAELRSGGNLEDAESVMPLQLVQELGATRRQMERRTLELTTLETELARRVISPEDAQQRYADLANPIEETPPDTDVAGSKGYPDSWDMNVPLKADRTARPIREFLNYAKFGLDRTTEARLRAVVDKGREAGSIGKTPTTVAKQEEEANAFARELVANPLMIDAEKVKSLTGPQIKGLMLVAGQNTQILEGLTQAMESGTLSATEMTEALEMHDRLEESADKLLGYVITGKERYGQGLFSFRQTAKYSVDPTVWLVKAKKQLGDTPMTDKVMLRIRELAEAAAQACKNG